MNNDKVEAFVREEMQHFEKQVGYINDNYENGMSELGAALRRAARHGLSLALDAGPEKIKHEKFEYEEEKRVHELLESFCCLDCSAVHNFNTALDAKNAVIRSLIEEVI